jgi:hypothetical protein
MAPTLIATTGLCAGVAIMFGYLARSMLKGMRQKRGPVMIFRAAGDEK